MTSLSADLNDDRFGKLSIDIVSSILDRNNASTLKMTNYGDSLTAVAAKGKKKCIKLLVVGFDTADYVFATFVCFS